MRDLRAHRLSSDGIGLTTTALWLPAIRSRRIDSSAQLGRQRWVVERCFAWLNRLRCPALRYERRANLHLAGATLAGTMSMQARAMSAHCAGERGLPT
jgi:transposase